MLKRNPGILLAKKANRFGFFGLRNEREIDFKQEFFMRTLLDWIDRFDFDGKLVLENEAFIRGFKDIIFSKGDKMAEKLYLSSGFFSNLNESDLKILGIEIDPTRSEVISEDVMIFDERFIDKLGLPNFIRKLRYLLGRLPERFSDGTWKRDETDLRPFEKSRFSSFEAIFLPESYSPEAKPSELIKTNPLKRIYKRIKKHERWWLQRQMREEYNGLANLAYKFVLEDKGFIKGQILPKSFDRWSSASRPRLEFLKKRALFEYLLVGKCSLEIMRLVPELETQSVVDANPVDSAYNWLMFFIHRFKEPRLIEAIYENVDSDSAEALILQERLLELNYIGDRRFCKEKTKNFALQYAGLRLKKKLDPKRYSDQELKKNKKLLKQIRECGHSPYVISLFERGLINRPPRTMTPKLAIYFAKKGLIKSYDEIPGLRIEEYPEIEFSLLKEGIMLDGLRPIHLSKAGEDLSVLASLFCPEHMQKLVKDSTLIRRLERSFKLFLINATSSGNLDLIRAMEFLETSLRRVLYAVESSDEKSLLARLEGELGPTKSSFYCELKKALEGKSFDGNASIVLEEDDIQKILEIIEEHYEESKESEEAEVLRALLLYGLSQASLGKLPDSYLYLALTRELRLEQLMVVSYSDNLMLCPFDNEGLINVLDLIKAKAIEGCSPDKVRDDILRRLVYVMQSDFLYFLHDRGIKLFGLDTKEIVRKYCWNKKSNARVDYQSLVLAPILFEMGISEAEILAKCQKNFGKDYLTEDIASIMDVHAAYDFKTRAAIARSNPNRRIFNKDRSKAVVKALASVGALEGQNLYEDFLLERRQDLHLNMIRNGSDQDLFYLIEISKEKAVIYLEYFLRKEERKRKVISKLPRREIRFKRRSIKNDPISKFIRSSMGKGRV